MSNLKEIEAAIENLPEQQLEHLAHWLEKLRNQRKCDPAVERWLESARGAAKVDIRTEDVMVHTRGEE